MGRESAVTPSMQATSGMNHLFLKTATGEIDLEVVNEQLVGYIQSIAERYYMIDIDTRKSIIKGLKAQDYFKEQPLDKVERSFNETIERLTGMPYTGVAEYYTFLVETAREENEAL